MRRALVLALLLACSCGDSTPKPVAAPPAAAPEAPVAPEFAVGDEQIAQRVFDAARSGKVDELATLTLPPRCDRVRIAVRALHDQLLGVRTPPVERGALLAALDALAKSQGGASATSLGPLVAAWRAWTPAEAAAEKDLALRYAKGLDALRQEKLDAAALTAPLANMPDAPPKSAAAANLAFLRAASLVAQTPDDGSVPQPIVDAYDHAMAAFVDLGWPGGFGSLAELLARRLLHEDPKSFRALHLIETARAAYALGPSKDEVRAALSFLVEVSAAERGGDVSRAEYLADAARLRLLPTGCRGRELVDVLRVHGGFAQHLGRQTVAARDLGKAWDEAKAARLDAATMTAIASPLATADFRLGRFDDARAVALEAARIQDSAAGDKSDEASRASLDEVAAEAALELGRAAESVEGYRAAAARYDKLAKDAPKRWAPERDTALLMAARAQARGGDAGGAAKAVAAVLASGDQPAAIRASAASVLREADRLADADRELSRAETDGGPRLAELLVEERANLCAARGDAAAARDLFRKTIDRVTADDPNRVAGWDAARPLLDWARMEMKFGRLFEASQLAARAVDQLADGGLAMELDRARKLFVDLQRRRLWFVDAETTTLARLAVGPPGDAARREEALLDLLLVRIELLFQRRKDAEKNALATAEMFEEGWRRELAASCVLAALARPGARDAIHAPPAGASPRWRLLHDVADSGSDPAALATRCGEAEPELRRWLAPRVFGTAADDARTTELRRHADIAAFSAANVALDADEAVLLIEPQGGHTTVSILRAGRSSHCELDGDAGLGAFWDACWVDRSKLDAAAKGVSDAIFDGVPEIARDLLGVRRLWISAPEPTGPLPFDLLSFENGVLAYRFEVVVVKSLAELGAAQALASPPMLSTLASPYATLDSRYALVQVGDVDPAARARLFALLGEFQNKGEDASAALRHAKLQLRAEWKADPKKPPTIPPWAAFLLRGAP